MLTLATDVDPFARHLFEPLTMQTIHWLTAETKEESPAISAMLEAVMDAIADTSHSGVREFGARCLGEFIRYAIKHQRTDDSAKHSPLGVSSLLSRLYGLAQHPSALHRSQIRGVQLPGRLEPWTPGPRDPGTPGPQRRPSSPPIAPPRLS